MPLSHSSVKELFCQQPASHDPPSNYINDTPGTPDPPSNVVLAIQDLVNILVNWDTLPYEVDTYSVSMSWWVCCMCEVCGVCAVTCE